MSIRTIANDEANTALASANTYTDEQIDGHEHSFNDLKDKPFGEEKAFEPIVWDGNTEGLESIVIPANDDINRLEIVFYKVADEYIKIADADEVESYTILAEIGGKEQIQIMTPEITTQMGLDFVTVSEHGCIFEGYIVSSDGQVQYPDSSVVVPSGVWFVKNSIAEIGLTAYVTEFIPSVTTKPIDEKYIPDTIATTIYVDEQIASEVANLLNNSTEAVDSIMELASAMENNADAIEALETVAAS